MTTTIPRPLPPDQRWNTGSRWNAPTVETVFARLEIIQAKGSEVHVGDIVCAAVYRGATLGIRSVNSASWAPSFRVTAQGGVAGVGSKGETYQRWETTSCVTSGNDYTDEIVVSLDETFHIVDTLARTT